MSREAAVRELYEQTVALTDGQRSSLLESSDFDPVVATRAQQLLTAATLLSSGRAAPTPKPPDTPPAKVGRYEILGVLGQGGFGIVYSGRDTVLKRRVAIKMCLSDDEELRRRFVHEAEISAALQHPNVVTIYDFGVSDGLPYLVQELLSGEDMSDTIRDSTPADLDLDLRIRALLGVAEGLAHAHRHGVVHRDIKPSNVRLTDTGGIKLLDFGIAQLLHRHSDLSVDESVAGTVGYLAPEQLNGEAVGKSADVFSFGALAFEWLTGKRAFPGVSFAEVAYGLLFHPVELDELRLAGVPEGLVAVVERCLRKDAAERYEDAAYLADDLRDLHLGGTVDPTSDPTSSSQVPVDVDMSQTPAKKPGPGRWIAGLLMAVGMVFGLWRGLEEPERAEDGSTGGVGSTQGTESAALGSLTPEPLPGPSEPTGTNPADPPPGNAVESEILGEEEVSSKAPQPARTDPERPPPSDPSPPVEQPVEQEPPAQSAEQTTEKTTKVDQPEAATAGAAREIAVAESPEGEGPGDPKSPVETSEIKARAVMAPPPVAEPEAADPSLVSADPSSAVPSEATPPAKGRVDSELESPQLYMEGQAGVIPPQPIDAPSAEYPRRARRRQITTQVVVAVLVDAQGRVTRTLLERRDRSELGFNEAAETAARATRFEPATLDGVRGSMWARLIYNFKP